MDKRKSTRNKSDAQQKQTTKRQKHESKVNQTHPIRKDEAQKNGGQEQCPPAQGHNQQVVNQESTLGDINSVDPNSIFMMGRRRVFIGSLPPNSTEQYVRNLLEPYGELDNCYVNTSANFAMVRFLTREQAYKAQVCLHCTTHEGKLLVVRLAPHPAAVWVGELGPVVTNELLYSAFSRFGDVEKALVARDQRGRSLGYGVVEFKQKQSARNAIQTCLDNSYLITRLPKPIQVREWKFKEEDVGLVSTDVHNDTFYFPMLHEEQELTVPPRFSRDPNYPPMMSTMADRWIKLYNEERLAKDELKRKFDGKRNQLEKEMKFEMREEKKKREEVVKQEERRLKEKQAQLLRDLAQLQSKIQNHGKLNHVKPAYYGQHQGQNIPRYAQHNLPQMKSQPAYVSLQQQQQQQAEQPYQPHQTEQPYQPQQAFQSQGYNTQQGASYPPQAQITQYPNAGIQQDYYQHHVQ